MKYIITSAFDPNHSFEVEADTIAEAAFQALGELGWGVALTDNDEAEADANPRFDHARFTTACGGIWTEKD